MKKNKGITLIELLISIAVTAILLSLVISAILTNVELYNKTQYNNQAQIVTSDIFSSIDGYFAHDSNRLVSIVDSLPAPANYRHNEDYLYVKDGYIYLLEFSKTTIDPYTGKFLDSSGKDISNTAGTIVGDSKLSFQGSENFTYTFSVDPTKKKFIEIKILADLYPYDNITFTDHIYLRKNTSVDTNTLSEGTILKIVTEPAPLLERKR